MKQNASHVFLAMDFGAESGRAEVVSICNEKVVLEEILRFPNRPVRMGKVLFWDFPFLFAEILVALRICKDRGIPITSIGIDTWGVDFGLLGSDDQLLGNPVHYRDNRTDDIAEYTSPIMSIDEIFSVTSCRPWPLCSLFQLAAMQREGSPILPLARTYLNIAELFNFFLTGVKAAERSNLSTSCLMDAEGQWCHPVISHFNFPDMFPNIVEPGTVLGPLQGSVCNHVGLHPVPVIASCGHDTSAVAAAVPGIGNRWSFLSCGTWSILGKIQDHPITNLACLQAGFSNEYTLGGWFLCRNISGLWILQELRRKWNTCQDVWDYSRMTEEASKASSGALIDINDASLMSPTDMETALRELLDRQNWQKPDSRGALVRCVLDSLALEHAFHLRRMDQLTQQSSDSLFMVGGGISNSLLCQLTANACGVPVYAGTDQCAALGNALTQAVAMGILNNCSEVRQVMRNSFHLSTYESEERAYWEDRFSEYECLKHDQCRR